MRPVVNPATGEEVTLLSETPELLVMENVHPGMEERRREFVERLFANGGAPEPGMLARFGREIAPP